MGVGLISTGVIANRVIVSNSRGRVGAGTLGKKSATIYHVSTCFTTNINNPTIRIDSNATRKRFPSLVC